MSEAARVTAIDAINELRVALVCFGDEATEALSAADADVRRVEEWLTAQLKDWQHQVRRCEDEVTHAKTELTRRKMLNYEGRAVDTTEQELALRRALARLEYAEEQVEVSRRWV